MLELIGTIGLDLLLLWGYIAVASLHKRLAVKLIVCVSDECTEVLNTQGVSLVKVPNKIVYTLQENNLQVIAIGKSLRETASMQQKEGRGLREVDLIFDQEVHNNLLDGIWRRFLVFCCEKARQALRKRWSPLSVEVIARTSSSLTNQKVREAAQHKSLGAFGEFKVADASNTV
jgi:hypothetical protein